jgi:hypothetical protein
MEIVDNWIDQGEKYWTVEISKGKYVDVKQPNENFIYIMQNQDGTEIYDKYGKTYDEMTMKITEEVLELIERNA